jgi:hypothetical protein
MRKRWFNQPSTAISMVALFVALAGTGYAATAVPPNSVGTPQLKNSAVTTAKLANGAVTKAKLNLAGVTVPNATHAGTATHATTATIGDSPVAWAEVSSTGEVIAGRGITSANITLEPTAAYCFHGLGFQFKSAAVTPDGGSSAAPGMSDTFSLQNSYNCGGISGLQAEVTTSEVAGSAPNTGVAFAQLPFFIQFFN